MDAVKVNGKTHWEQWDEQEKRRRQTQAWIALSNLYLKLERHAAQMTLALHNELRVLVGKAYDYGDPMIDWWQGEFQKLPNWLTY